MKYNKMVITVTQEEGSGGRAIAEEVAQTLKLNYIDEMVIRLATDRLTQLEIEDYIRQIAKQGRMIIVGCGANLILKDYTDIINILVHAPLSKRIDNLIQTYQLDRATAEKKLLAVDQQYNQLIRHYYGPDWSNPDLYDLIVNTANLSVEKAVAGISRFVESLEESRCQSEAEKLVNSIRYNTGEHFYYDDRYQKTASALSCN